MPNASSQLSAFGNLDILLTGDPQGTFWKANPRRHTPFALTSVEVPLQGDADFGRRVTATIPKTVADLLKTVWLEVTLPDLTTFSYEPTSATNIKWVNSIGHALLSTAEFAIAGTRIDRQYPVFMDIFSELTEKYGKYETLKTCIGQFDHYDNTDDTGAKSFGNSRVLYVPIPFFFSTSTSNALPMTAMTFVDMQVNLEFAPLLQLIKSSTSTVTSMFDSMLTPPKLGVRLFADMVYLGDIERDEFVRQPHEYLVETVQFMGNEPVLAPSSNSGVINRKITLNFSQPVKELIWVFQSQQNALVDSLNGNNIFDYSNVNAPLFDTIDKVVLQLDGVDRTLTLNGSYFRLMQPYRHHTNHSRKMVYVYSFALDPAGTQPTGHVNMSRIQSANFQFQLNPSLPNGVLQIYAVSWNVLRIDKGYAGLQFTN